MRPRTVVSKLTAPGLRGPIGATTATAAMGLGVVVDVLGHAQTTAHQEALFDPHNLAHVIIGVAFVAFAAAMALTMADSLRASRRATLVTVGVVVATFMLSGVALAAFERANPSTQVTAAGVGAGHDHDRDAAATPRSTSAHPQSDSVTTTTSVIPIHHESAGVTTAPPPTPTPRPAVSQGHDSHASMPPPLPPPTMPAHTVPPMAGPSRAPGGGHPATTQPATHEGHGVNPGGAPDPAQIALIRQSTQKYLNVNVAIAEGYGQSNEDSPGEGAHFDNAERYAQTQVDLTKPSFLMYTKRLTGAWKLVAVGYTVDRAVFPNAPTQVVGAMWHNHDNICDVPRVPFHEFIENTSEEACRALGGEFSARTEWMLHVWAILDNPNGMWADDHPAIGE